MLVALIILVVLVGVVQIWRTNTMVDAVENLTAKVEAQTSVIASASTLLATLANEIRENAGDEDALNALADRIDDNTTSLANAVEANTLPADEQPVPGEGEEPTA